MKIAVKLNGLQDVMQRLNAVNGELRSTILRKATTAGAQVLTKEAKGRAPRETGLLRKSLGYKVRVYRGGELVLAMVGPRSGFKRSVVTLGSRGAISGTKAASKLLAAGGFAGTRNPVRYAHMSEFGTSRSAAKPFLRPALNAAHDRIVEIMRQTIEAGISSALSKAA